MQHDAICIICNGRIGIGTVSADVHDMAVTIHTMCLPGLGGTSTFQLGNGEFSIQSNPKEQRADYGDAVRGYKKGA